MRDTADSTRREFLRINVASLAAAATAPGWTPLAAAETGADASGGAVRLGVVADVHQDIIHDGFARMNAFIADMQRERPDAIIQLSDFAVPRSRNQPFLDRWNEFDGPRHHVLGNHDMRDFGFKKDQTVEWWGMTHRYYSFDLGGWHCVVLDGNDQNPGEWTGYPRYVDREQLDWLAADLQAHRAPTIVFSHQTIESDAGVANSGAVRAVLEAANRNPRSATVVACLCGHHHTDSHLTIAGIHYIQINSMSYKWIGAKYARRRFPDHVEATYPTVRRTFPYRDPLYTMLTLDARAGVITLAGAETEFIPPSPLDVGAPGAEDMLPKISQRRLALPAVRKT